MAEVPKSRSVPCGHDEQFVNPPGDDLHCIICFLPSKEPVLTRCDHRFCRQCLEEYILDFLYWGLYYWFSVSRNPNKVSNPQQSSWALHCLAFAAVFGTNLARFVVQGKCSGLSALHEKTWFSKRCLPHPCFSSRVERTKALIKRLHFTLAYIRTYLIKHLLEKLRHL